MRVPTLLTLAALSAASLPGCPLYDESHDCVDDRDCARSARCDLRSGRCVLQDSACRRPLDCSANETCGADARCHVGDCTFHGCVSGFQCRGLSGSWECVAVSSAGGSAGGGGSGGSAGAAAGGGAGDAGTDG